ncbi:MAG TPA: putative toxin-antitoxin system toxin component, PIN family [Phycisphaerae bacterium]|nr:putative toxin-antitoxin system toxin component, PIN family [Phycisphaerae bacterium]
MRSRDGAAFLLLDHIADGSVNIHLSVPVFFEYRDVLARQPHRLRLSETEIGLALNALCAAATLHDIHYIWRPSLRDPKDEIFLELAVTANCRTIVTHNIRDFAGADTFGIDVVTPLQFLRNIGALS